VSQQLQCSPLHTVRCNALNVYLDINDIPVIDRMPNYERPFYKEVRPEEERSDSRFHPPV